MKNQIAVALILVAVILPSSIIWIYQQNDIQKSYDSGYKTGYDAGAVSQNSSGYQAGWSDGNATGYNTGAERASNLVTNVTFNSTELQNFESVKSRLTVYNADPAFTGDRTLQWISMRNSSAAPWDPYQKSMEYLCFWRGQGGKGEWETVVSIYNSPGSLSNYVVEVSRFTWHEIQVKLDGNLKADFPQVTMDTTSTGYTTFNVPI